MRPRSQLGATRLTAGSCLAIVLKLVSRCVPGIMIGGGGWYNDCLPGTGFRAGIESDATIWVARQVVKGVASNAKKRSRFIRQVRVGI